MNREWKRMMRKQQKAADRPAATRAPGARRERTKSREFVKQVRDELARVAWPNRQEIITYTIVVIISAGFFMGAIALMDIGFAELVLWFLGRGGN